MTAITQKIRRFTGGISDQPDEQKIPGQLRDAVNCIPDVVQGLVKRPGLNLINELSTTKYGKWFFVDKSNNFTNFDRYVGRIDNRETLEDGTLNPTRGKVQVWDLENGKEMDVCYTDNVDPLELRTVPGGTRLVPEYANAYVCETEPGEDPRESYFFENEPDIDDLQTLTINDYTFVVNRKVPVAMNTNIDEIEPPRATAELRTIAGQQEYKLEFWEPNPDAGATAALSLSITNSGFENDPPTCSAATDADGVTFTNQSAGSGTGLSFTITTTAVVAPGTQLPDGTIPNNCVYTSNVELVDGGDGFAVGDVVSVLINGTTYDVRVDSVGQEETRQLIGEATYTTPSQDPKADVLLADLASDIEGFSAGFTVEVIGTSLWIERANTTDQDGNTVIRPFTVTTPNSILIRPLSSTAINNAETSFVIQANDVADVPLQTRHNQIFQIRNSFTDVDDYYLQFRGDNNQDGTGTYVEVAKPGIPHTLNPASMPHGILRLSETRRDADNDIIVTFLVASFQWASREAGDDVTNPRPSFAPQDGAVFGRPINNISFYRNRFVTLSDENVVCSVAGDFFNFWNKTAISGSPSDPIDLQVSNNFPAVLFNSTATTSGLIMFSENAQFMLGTENDIFEPRTARTTLLSSYNFNRDSNPINLGTTVGFVSGIGRYTRFYEMANVSRDQEPEVVEQSKVVERLMPGDYQQVGISKDNQIVAFGKREYDTVWIFRYFNTGEKRAQSAWSRWKFDGNLVAHACINDSYFLVIEKENKIYLTRADLRALSSTQVLTEDGEEYRVYLDYVSAANITSVVYNERNDRSTITLDMGKTPTFTDSSGTLTLISYNPDTEQGIILPYSSEFNIAGDAREFVFFVGYTYEMLIELPQFFVKKEGSGQVSSWDTANLIIQRVKLNLGRVGYYETTLNRLGRPDYTQIYEAKPMDQYDANNLGYMADYEQTTPVYQRNTTFKMTVKSDHPAPAVLYSATWEGQYQENYVKRL